MQFEKVAQGLVITLGFESFVYLEGNLTVQLSRTMLSCTDDV